MSFSDMSLILLSFFALMLSVSRVDKQKFENVHEGMNAKTADDMQKRTRNLKSIAAELQAEITKRKLNEQAKVFFDSEGVAIEFSDKLVFPSGSASPNQEFVHVTDQVMAIIAASTERYDIRFEGHTDDTPLSGKGDFKSNWDLSSARALALLRQLRDRGVSEGRMSLSSYAHTKPKVSLEGKQGAALERARAANRRVVIKIE